MTVQDVPFPPFETPAPPWETLPPQVVVIIALAMVAGFTIVFWPLMRALARRIEGKARTDPALLEEMDQMRQRLAEVDTLTFRLGELEERLDFAERMLAQRKEPNRLPGG